jgi:prepilin-type N-terminal cleavage/methylation domain-containing protein
MKLFFSQKNNSHHKGFTLLEVLIAITILVFAITATFTSAQTGIQSAQESKNQIISFYIAQEAIEYIRNVRDSNGIKNVTTPTNWLKDIAENSNSAVDDPCSVGTYCVVDTVNSTLTQCPGGLNGCPYLMQNMNAGQASYLMYGQNGGSGWVNTTFKRVVQIVKVNTKQADITVTVYWSRGSFTTQFIVHESIFDWQS